MRQTILAAAILLTVGVTGCHIDTDKHGDGDNVKIETPFGGMQVKSSSGDTVAGIGLPTYPGAIIFKKNHGDGKDKDSDGPADVNMSFGSFQLKIKAVEYRTDDSPKKVFDFYRKALGRYGDVIQCSNDRPVGTPVHTAEGLTCEHDADSGIHVEATGSSMHYSAKESKDGKSAFDGSAKTQLKAGSKKHQHLVDINPDGNGARFGLVALDLPGEFHFGSDKDQSDDHHDKEQ